MIRIFIMVQYFTFSISSKYTLLLLILRLAKLILVHLKCKIVLVLSNCPLFNIAIAVLDFLNSLGKVFLYLHLLWLIYGISWLFFSWLLLLQLSLFQIPHLVLLLFEAIAITFFSLVRAFIAVEIVWRAILIKGAI